MKFKICGKDAGKIFSLDCDILFDILVGPDIPSFIPFFWELRFEFIEAVRRL